MKSINRRPGFLARQAGSKQAAPQQSRLKKIYFSPALRKRQWSEWQKERRMAFNSNVICDKLEASDRPKVRNWSEMKNKSELNFHSSSRSICLCQDTSPWLSARTLKHYLISHWVLYILLYQSKTLHSCWVLACFRLVQQCKKLCRTEKKREGSRFECVGVKWERRRTPWWKLHKLHR